MTAFLKSSIRFATTGYIQQECINSWRQDCCQGEAWLLTSLLLPLSPVKLTLLAGIPHPLHVMHPEDLCQILAPCCLNVTRIESKINLRVYTAPGGRNCVIATLRQYPYEAVFFNCTHRLKSSRQVLNIQTPGLQSRLIKQMLWMQVPAWIFF